MNSAAVMPPGVTYTHLILCMRVLWGSVQNIRPPPSQAQA